MTAHIETKGENCKSVARSLSRLNSHSFIEFPLGIRMQLVSEFRNVKGNIVNMGKHMRLRVRQSNFQAMIEGLPNGDIMLLGYVPTTDSETLQEMIMAIDSTNKGTPGCKGHFTMIFLQNNADKARMIENVTITYLLHYNSFEVLTFFDPEAVVDKEDWY